MSASIVQPYNYLIIVEYNNIRTYLTIQGALLYEEADQSVSYIYPTMGSSVSVSYIYPTMGSGVSVSYIYTLLWVAVLVFHIYTLLWVAVLVFHIYTLLWVAVLVSFADLHGELHAF